MRLRVANHSQALVGFVKSRLRRMKKAGTHPITRTNTTASAVQRMWKAVLSASEKGIAAACPIPQTMVVAVSARKPPPKAHNAMLLPAWRAISPNQAAVTMPHTHGTIIIFM